MNKYLMWSMFALATYAVHDYQAGTLDMDTVRGVLGWLKNSVGVTSIPEL
jgi:hypothetical protein